MRPIFCLIMAFSIMLNGNLANGAERALRSTGSLGTEANPLRDDPQGSDETQILKYQSNNYPSYFWTLPNDYGDDFLNVRFTPEFEPFYIIGAYLALFNMDSISGGPAGTPGVKISVFQSGIQDDSTGYPTDLIDARDFPFISEDNDTLVLSHADYLYWNFLDLRPLQIGFNDLVDFHLAVSSISDEETDTVAVFHDDGRLPYRSDRSGLWNGQDSVWVKMKYLPGIRLGLNFYLMAIVSDNPNGNYEPGDLTVQGLELPPDLFILTPAFPNPFNSTTSLRFSIPERSPYSVNLFDHQGRQLRQLGQGTGGSGILALDAGSLASGTYFVMLSTPNGVVTQPIQLIR